MDRGIFEKGARLLREGQVRPAGETDKAAYFEVTGESHDVHQVRVMRDHSFNCTCTWGTLKGAPYGCLCSHVVAVVLTLAEGRAAIEAGSVH